VGGDFSARRIGPIAYSLGFKNVSAFNRTFREHYGMSPREARVRAVSAAPSPLPAAPEQGPDETQTLAHWLRRIGAAPAGGNAK
jgi:AraC-like DNA-binding protein